MGKGEFVLMADWKSIVGTVAPMLGTALGGPLVGQATRVMMDKFGITDESELPAFIAGADPATLLELKRLDVEFETTMAELGITREQIAAEDRDSARDRQVEMRDWTPNVLGAVIVVGFFATLVLFAKHSNVINESAMPVINIMIGALGAMTVQVTNYFFGSSAGSKRKTSLMGNGK